MDSIRPPCTAVPTVGPTVAMPERVAVAGLIALAVFVHGWLFAHTHATARDSVLFATTAWKLDAAFATRSPEVVLLVLQESPHPPGYPLAVWLAWQPVRLVSAAPLPEQLILAARIASLLAAVGLAVVHYRLGRALFDPATGLVAAGVFQILPVAARVTSDGLSEGLFLAFAALTWLAAANAFRTDRGRGFFHCGAAAAAAYLVRPEGFLLVVATAGVVVAFGVARRRELRAVPGRLAALVCGFVVLAWPYMTVIGGLTNKPSGQQFLQDVAATATPANGVPRPLFAAWFVPGEDGPKSLWVAAAIGKETVKTFHYAPAGLALVGLVLFGRRAWRTDPALAVPLAFAALDVAAVVWLANGREYVSERHTLPLALVGNLFAAAAVWPAARWVAALPGVGRVGAGPVTAGLLLLYVATCVPATFRPLHPNRVGHIHAGRWLAAHAAPDGVIVDPYDWARFYAGRAGVDAGPAPPVLYAVVERGKDHVPNPRLHWSRLAEAASRRGRAVYQWPEVGPVEQAQVVVYEVPWGRR